LENSTTIASSVLSATNAVTTSLSYPRSISTIVYGKKSLINNTIELDGSTYTGSVPSIDPNINNLDIPTVESRGDVRISQLIVVNRQITATEKQNLLDYLNSKA